MGHTGILFSDVVRGKYEQIIVNLGQNAQPLFVKASYFIRNEVAQFANSTSVKLDMTQVA